MTHRWQFWLDAGHRCGLAAPVNSLAHRYFYKAGQVRPITIVEMEEANEANLSRTLHDLLGRAGEQVLLCHSELALTGQEQMGPLISLVGAAQPADDALVVASA